MPIWDASIWSVSSTNSGISVVSDKSEWDEREILFSVRSEESIRW